jgi:phage terminase small subunit
VPEKPPKPPSGLHAAGKRLWIEVHEDLEAAGWDELTNRERAVLRAACGQADLVADLEKALKIEGVIVKGAAGQKRLNATTTELRQSRIALARLLGELAFPDAEGEPPVNSASERGRKAAQARWQRRRGGHAAAA